MKTEVVFESDMLGMKNGCPNLDVPPSFFPGDIDFFSLGTIPGVFDVSTEEYHRIQAYSNTFGSSLIKNSPDYDKAFNPDSASSAMNFGSVYELYFEHLYKTIAEGKFKSIDELSFNIAEINDRVAIAGDWHKSSNLYKEFVKDNEGKIVVTGKDMLRVMRMLKSALSNKEFPHYLTGEWQTVLLWIEDGLPMKCMIDHLATNLKSRNKLQAGDLKTSASATEFGFKDSADRYYYDHQAVHYMSGLEHCLPERELAPFVWYVCESQEPFGNAIYEIDEFMIEAGEIARQHSIHLTKQIFKEGVPEFPLYTDAFEDGKKVLSFNDKVMQKRFKLEWTYESTTSVNS